MATLHEQTETIAASDLNTPLAFALAPAILILINDGPNTVYLTLASTAATLNGFPIHKDETHRWTFDSDLQAAPTDMGLVCAAGETASVRVGAWR